MMYLNNGKEKKNYFLIAIQLVTIIFIISPVINPQSKYSGSVETDKYNLEYQVTNLNVPSKYIYALYIIKETKTDIDNSISVPDTIKLILFLGGYNAPGNNSVWNNFLRRNQIPNNSPFQIFIKGTNGYFKSLDVVANYEFRDYTTKEIFMSPSITMDEDRETLIITSNPKYAIEDAVELFINACWNEEEE